MSGQPIRIICDRAKTLPQAGDLHDAAAITVTTAAPPPMAVSA